MPKIAREAPLDFKVVNFIRRESRRSGGQGVRKTNISSAMGIAASTAAIITSKLSKNGKLFETPDNRIKVNGEYEYYAGISIGSSKVKLTICDYTFEPVTIDSLKIKLSTATFNRFEEILIPLLEELSFIETEKNRLEFCKESPDDIENINRDLITICNFICNLYDMDVEEGEWNPFCKIKSVCCAFAGWVDFFEAKLLKSPNLNITSSCSIDRLFTESVKNKLEERNIQYFIEHNSKTAVVAEKEVGDIWVPSEDSPFKYDNVACAYMGVGVGLGLILQNELYRGNHNLSGQIGHAQMPPHEKSLGDDDLKNTLCKCGKSRCMEMYIRKDVFRQVEDLKSADIEKLETLLRNDETAADKLAYYLGEPLSVVLSMLSINDIVLTGKLSKLVPIIESKLNRIFIDHGIADIKIHTSSLGEVAAARGAAICAYFYSHECPITWNY